MSDKAALRTELLAARNAMPKEARRKYDASIGEQVLAWWHARPVDVLGVYWPIRGEPDLRPAYEELFRLGVQLALPVVVADDAPLRFAAWAPGNAVVKDAMGVSIPAPPQRVVQPQALLIPCVGYSRERARLGYGGGFYDRTLAGAPRPFAVGIAYSCALADFERAAHDAVLDLVITEAASIGA
ncbi:MAG TPA: 5-formyltetrahydrofolate cyclo-ligase [Paucimonas sp.]|nr:5-formyltetrahydrofolate cyclo-ligase [Paucimonas sp.]